MIVGLGVDLLAVPRVKRMLARFGEALLERLFLPGEATRPWDPEHVAGLVAAKEAAFKALGTGWAMGVTWRDVVVARTKAGKPELRLAGGAAARARSLGATRAHLSISHTAESAVAVVVLEQGPGGNLYLPHGGPADSDR